MKERKDLIDDALAATRAALEEGIVPGGGVALLRCAAALDSLQLQGDEAHGVKLVRNVLEMPLRTIAENAGEDGAVVAAKVRKGGDSSKGGDPNFGYDALNDQYGDMFKFGIVDPAKVVRTSLQNALSVAALLMTHRRHPRRRAQRPGRRRRPRPRPRHGRRHGRDGRRHGRHDGRHDVRAGLAGENGRKKERQHGRTSLPPAALRSPVPLSCRSPVLH